MMIILRNSIILLAFFWTSAFDGSDRLLAPKKDLWAIWQTNDPENMERIDHSLRDSFLKTQLIVEDGEVPRIDYGHISQNSRAQITSYIKSIRNLKIGAYNQQEQLAFWVNLYNASIVKLVMDHYPVGSIKDISLSFFSRGPWFEPILQVEKNDISFNDMEHRILRPIWEDPRIHYALNCASIGCPPLQPRAMTAENAEDYLDAGARLYINSPHGVRVTDNIVSTSRIYSWYVDDFGGTEQSVLMHLRRYANAYLTAQLLSAKVIQSTFYDWNLNDIKVD